MHICQFVSTRLRRVASSIAAVAVLATASLVAATAAAQQGSEMKPVAVIAASSYQELVADIDFLGQFAGQVNAGQQMENMLRMFTQEKGLQGLDKTQPWGVVVQTDGFQFTPVVCVPVTDLAALLDMVKAFGMTVSDVGDGITEVEAPNQSAYVKEEANWAFIAQQPELLTNTPADPADLFKSLADEYDVGARVIMQNVPEMYRSIAIEQMRAGAEQGMQRMEGESDEAFEARRKMTEANIEQISQAFNELDELLVGFNADAEQGAFIDFAYSGLPDTQVAKAISAYESAETEFAGCLNNDAAIRFNTTVSTPPELLEQQREQMKAQIQSLRQQAINAIDQEAELPNEEARQTIKDAVNDLMDAFDATASAGRIDVAGHVRLDGESIDLVAGGFVKETAKVESAAKKLAALVEDDPNFSVTWDAESHQGAAIHTISITVPTEESEARAILGETVDIALALGEEVVFVTTGPDAVANIKQAIDGSGSSSQTSVKPMEWTMSLTPIVRKFAEASPAGNPVVDSMLNALTTKSNGDDHVRMTAEATDNKLRARILLEKGVLEAIGAAARAARQAGAGAGF